MVKPCLFIKRQKHLNCGMALEPEVNNETLTFTKMIRIGVIGDIGSGKSYVANNFGYPVFNADQEVSNL